MDKRIRRAFQDARERLQREQIDVATKGGVSQSTVSKIEADPHYQPSLETFRKALVGVDHTLLSFFRELDGASTYIESDKRSLTTSQAAPQNPPEPRGDHTDVASRVHTAADAHALQTAIAHALIDAGTLLIRSLDAGERPRRKNPDPRTRQPQLGGGRA